MWRWFGIVAVVGCSERVPAAGPSWDPDFEGTGAEDDPAPVDTAAPSSACGAVHEVDLSLAGVLVRPDGAPVGGAEVRLEQRDWGPTAVLGSGVTGPDGRFVFPATAVPIIEGCWAIGPQFWAVGQLGELYAEDGANMELVQAWLDGRTVADLYRPLVVE